MALVENDVKSIKKYSANAASFVSSYGGDKSTGAIRTYRVLL